VVITVKLFVEGGGNSKSLRTECRAAFNTFLQKAGLSGYMPRIVASGSRSEAYSDYCTALRNGENAVLLVDSEAAVIIPKDTFDYAADDPRTWNPWYHLTSRRGQAGDIADPWVKPSDADDGSCHLMVQSMESWLLADIEALISFYGPELKEKSIPSRSDIENIAKSDVLDALKAATRYTQKGSYDKGNHSFRILRVLNPERVISSSPWARRFVMLLSEKMHSVR